MPRDAANDKREDRDDDELPTELPSEHPHSEDVEMDFAGTHAPRADIGIMELDSDDEESTQLLAQLGCSTRRAPTRRKNRPKAATTTTKEVTVSEIYFPPRIIQLLREMRARRSKQVTHIMPGFVFDLTTNDPTTDRHGILLRNP